jgi:1-acylglycerone phosphate reductase
MLRSLVYEAPAIEADPRRVRAMFDANVFGVFDVISAFTPLLMATIPETPHPSIIVNTASVLARVPYPFSSAYNASKAAVAAYSDTLRLELAPLGIKVVTLFMGVVSTGISSPSAIQFDPNSLFADAEAGSKQRSKDHQVPGMKADQFAEQVVESLLSNKDHLNKGEYIWKGSNAVFDWLLNAVGWRKIFDPSSEKEVGMDKITRQLIAGKGKAAVSRSK